MLKALAVLTLILLSLLTLPEAGAAGYQDGHAPREVDVADEAQI